MGRELDRFPQLTATDRSLIRNNVGAAIDVSHRLGGSGDQIASAARSAFIDSMHTSLWIAAALALGAALVARTQLPRHRHGQAVHGHAGPAGHHPPIHTVASHPSEVLV